MARNEDHNVDFKSVAGRDRKLGCDSKGSELTKGPQLAETQGREGRRCAYWWFAGLSGSLAAQEAGRVEPRRRRRP